MQTRGETESACESHYFGSQKLPTWSAERLWELFQLHRETDPTHEQREEYALLLMVFTTMRLRGMRLDQTLKKYGIDVEDTAQDVVATLLRKTPQFRIDKPHFKVLLRQLQTAIYRLVIETIRRPSVLLSANARAEDSDSDFFDRLPGRSIVDTLALLSRQLHGDEPENRVLRRIPGDVFALLATYRLVRRRLLCAGRIYTYPQLPFRLRRRVTNEQFNIVVARFRRLVDEFAQG